MKENKKKILELLCFVFVIISFIVIGYYTYQSYEKQKDKNENSVTVDNYYNSEYLFNNNYIIPAKTIADFSEEKNDVYMYLDANNVLYIKYTNNKTVLNKRVTSLPEGKITVYYNNLFESFYEFIALTDKNEVYYTYLNINSKKDYKFKKVGENISKVYIPSYDKKNVFVNKLKNINTNFIFLDTDNNLKYLDYKDKKYVLKDDINNKKPYFDYICLDINNEKCSSIMFYLTFENKLVYNYKNETIVQNEVNEDILVKDVFATIEIENSKNIDFTKTSFKEITKKYDYIYTIYIIDGNGKIYSIQLDKSNINNSTIIGALTYNEELVKELKYDIDKEEIKNVNIIYSNGKEEKITKDKNKVILTSTIYDKTKNDENKLLPTT